MPFFGVWPPNGMSLIEVDLFFSRYFFYAKVTKFNTRHLKNRHLQLNVNGNFIRSQKTNKRESNDNSVTLKKNSLVINSLLCKN